MRSHNHRHGFVLPMTLLVIALTAVVLVGVARQSLQLATEAAKARQDLQRRWGAVSCQRVMLEEADAWLSLPPDQLSSSSGDAGHRRFVFSLGDLDFDVLLADESAKINLNAMSKILPLPAVEKTARELAQSAQPLQVRLRPFSFASAALVGEEKKRDLTRLDSWGQVFPMQQFADPADAPRQIAAATVDVTCWGNGKLNVLRASESALQSLCSQLASASVARQLMSLRNRSEIIKEDELLAELKLDPREMVRLGTHLTAQSSTYSMWLNVNVSNNQTSPGSGKFRRGWYKFYVVAEKEKPPPPATGSDSGVETKDSGTTLSATDSMESRARPIPQARFAW